MLSLRNRAIGGVGWTFTQQFSGQLVSFVISIILARILLPSEFGLIGMIAVVIAIGHSLRDAGMSQSLIRSNKPTDVDYSTVFYINLAVSLFIYALIFFTAPFIAEFYGEKILTSIIRVLSIIIIIEAFSSIQQTKLTKEMNFKTQFIVDLPSIIIGGVVGVLMALADYGVWSIVGMQLTKNFLASLQLWIYSKWVPKRVFSWKRLKWHFNFGYKLTLSGLLDTVYNNMYNIIIGKYFSTAALGFYTRADATKQLPVQNISAALNKVTYPMFAEIKGDNKRLKNAYKLVMQQVLFWVAPLLIGGAVLGEPLFRFVFTEKWLPAVPMFQILCVVGIMYPLNAYNLSILKVKGRSDLFLKLEVIKKSITVVGLLLTIQYGIYALLYFQLLVSIFSYLINSFYSGILIDYSLKDQLQHIFPILAVGVLMGMVCYGFDWYLQILEAQDLLRILAGLILGGITYLGLSKVLNLAPYSEFIRIIKRAK